MKIFCSHRNNLERMLSSALYAMLRSVSSVNIVEVAINVLMDLVIIVSSVVTAIRGRSSRGMNLQYKGLVHPSKNLYGPPERFAKESCGAVKGFPLGFLAPLGFHSSDRDVVEYVALLQGDSNLD
ncbi:protein S-acyltransferase 21 [Pyrus ussuriensis x Pyrus communis]|uniref:Protein S-acyltransferase 21 n=1 Tax=Pyrus ussuriensis x Pyrus communis TaxID=2448454 RepID=A0A5N5HL46_9ROSA|nr:protein S-acyltransferase 21 [Pyrus ussuriensis x Pyrus communis]